MLHHWILPSLDKFNFVGPISCERLFVICKNGVIILQFQRKMVLIRVFVSLQGYEAQKLGIRFHIIARRALKQKRTDWAIGWGDNDFC